MTETNGKHQPIVPKKSQADLLASRLREREKDRRPNRLIMVVIFVVLFTVPVALVAWWFWPGAMPPPAQIVAFDDVALPNQKVPLRARVVLAENATDNIKLEGCPVVFGADKLRGMPSQEPWTLFTKTTPDGHASATKPAQKTPSNIFFSAVYAPEHKDVRVEDRAQIVFWPPKSNLLLVDVEHSLTDVKIGNWQKLSVRDVNRRQHVAEALNEIAKTGSFKFVYLACEVSRPMAYRNARNWVRMPHDDGKRFPAGPVLGRLTYENNSGAGTQLLKRIQSIQQSFNGKIIGATSSETTAATFAKAKLNGYFVGAAKKQPKKFRVVESWTKLPPLLQ